MTGVTLIAGINVCGIFAGGNHTVMTTFANTLRLVVIHRHPGGVVVAGIAEVASEDVRRAFSGRTRCIMTGYASLCCRGVIKYGHQPICRDMATVTSKCRRNVIHTDTCRNHAIVTRLTRTCDLCMIDQWIHRCPCRAVMTGFTNGRGGDVCCTSANSNHTVMTGNTRTYDLHVIHQRTNRNPCRIHMTGLTKIRGVDVRCTLTRCSRAIVTGHAGISNAGVIKCRD